MPSESALVERVVPRVFNNVVEQREWDMQSTPLGRNPLGQSGFQCNILDHAFVLPKVAIRSIKKTAEAFEHE
jgi:hypothetical protein